MIQPIQAIKPVAAFGHIPKFIREAEFLQSLVHAHIFPEITAGNEPINYPLVIEDSEFVNWLGGAKFVGIYHSEFYYFLVTVAGGVVSIYKTSLHSDLSAWMGYGAKIIAREHPIGSEGKAEALERLERLRSELAAKK